MSVVFKHTIRQYNDSYSILLVNVVTNRVAKPTSTGTNLYLYKCEGVKMLAPQGSRGGGRKGYTELGAPQNMLRFDCTVVQSVTYKHVTEYKCRLAGMCKVLVHRASAQRRGFNVDDIVKCSEPRT